ncbi:hypothetical protein QUF72_21985, partial [Desulfobacterales bacterium HSG2]|nr:hypothetical protein [Desulfobacterales bacterium HSG2]
MNDLKTILLKREASMSSMSIGMGLTQLRRYDFAQTGYFYSSIFLISTGLERLLKLILIYDYRLKNNNTFPDNKKLKNFGHNLKDLINKSIQICKDYDLEMETHFFDN